MLTVIHLLYTTGHTAHSGAAALALSDNAAEQEFLAERARSAQLKP